jgi:predicted nucleic acid-binding protein
VTRVVVNSTPLIALSLVGHLSLLKIIFDEVVVPASVHDEVVVQGKSRPGAVELGNADWIVVKAPQEKPSLSPMLLGLDQGEMDVILLARELEADWVLVDEKLGRKVAEAVGLRVKGTLGVLLIAYRAGLLSRKEAEEAVERLAESTTRVSARLVTWFEAQLCEE